MVRSWQLVDMRIYPLKSGAGYSVLEATVERWGLAGDRRWAVVDEAGDSLWLGQHPRMVSVRARNSGDGGLLLSAPGMPGLKVPPVIGRPVPVGFTGLDHAIAAGDDAHTWFTRLLDRARPGWSGWQREFGRSDPARRHHDCA